MFPGRQSSRCFYFARLNWTRLTTAKKDDLGLRGDKWRHFSDACYVLFCFFLCQWIYKYYLFTTHLRLSCRTRKHWLWAIVGKVPSKLTPWTVRRYKQFTTLPYFCRVIATQQHTFLLNGQQHSFCLLLRHVFVACAHPSKQYFQLKSMLYLICGQYLWHSV